MGYDASDPYQVKLRKEEFRRSVHASQERDNVNGSYENVPPSGRPAWYTGPRTAAQPPVQVASQPQGSGPSPVSVALATASVPILPMARINVWDELSAVGSLRALSVSLREGNGYEVVLKIITHTGQKVYRRGFTHDPSQVAPLIHRWVEAGYWTPDKF